MNDENIARLLVTCPDRSGIVQAVSGFLYHQGANIVSLDQYTTQAHGGKYFMRVAFHLPELLNKKEQLLHTFEQNVAQTYQMQWRLSCNQELKKVGILVSKEDHALLELLWRYSRGMLPCQITKVVSNHADLREAVESFGITFVHVPVDKDNKQDAYDKIDELMQGNDLLVLARYMQILTPAFVDKWEHKIINIHHSFLPAFIGANPYKQAHERGVKMIGATSHFVTDDLDEGPIIYQDIIKVNHSQNAKDLAKLGKEVEKKVLAEALKLVFNDKVFIDENKTVIFE